MAYFSSAGSTLAISAAAPASEDAAGYNALTWTTIGEITELGELGATSNLITHNPVADKITRKLKGARNYGAMNLSMARDTSDAGQTLLRAAAASDNLYSFRLTLQNGYKMMFRGLVMGSPTSVGSVDSVTAMTCNIELSSAIVEV
jgi:hypothetical protein